MSAGFNELNTLMCINIMIIIISDRRNDATNLIFLLVLSYFQAKVLQNFINFLATQSAVRAAEISRQ